MSSVPLPHHSCWQWHNKSGILDFVTLVGDGIQEWGLYHGLVIPVDDGLQEWGLYHDLFIPVAMTHKVYSMKSIPLPCHSSWQWCTRLRFVKV